MIPLDRLRGRAMTTARWSVLAGVLVMMAASADSGLPPLPSGKPGLYEFRASTNGGVLRAKGAGDLPENELHRLADESLAHWVTAFRFCVGQGGSKLFDPAGTLGAECTYSGVETRKGGYSAEARCVTDQGSNFVHLMVESDAPEHQIVSMSAPLPGTSFAMITRYEIAWVSANCGDIPPGAQRAADGKLIKP